jgi:hypothetical protein
MSPQPSSRSGAWRTSFRPGRWLLASGAISADNGRIITQEWLAEGITMWGIAAFVIAATAVTGTGDIRAGVYRVAAGLLVAVGVLTALTGARTRVVWFKVCPWVMTGGAALLLTASLV